jgi:hypothetical protein
VAPGYIEHVNPPPVTKAQVFQRLAPHFGVADCGEAHTGKGSYHRINLSACFSYDDVVIKSKYDCRIPSDVTTLLMGSGAASYMVGKRASDLLDVKNCDIVEHVNDLVGFEILEEVEGKNVRAEKAIRIVAENYLKNKILR